MGIRNIGFLTDKEMTVYDVIREFGEIPVGTKIVIRSKVLQSHFYSVTIEEDVDVLSKIPEKLLDLIVTDFSASKDGKCWNIIISIPCISELLEV